jgi:hypothetical protein
MGLAFAGDRFDCCNGRTGPVNQSTRLVAESARNMSWLGHSELGGRSDGVQVMANKGYAYVGHPFSGGGATVIDVRNPREPKPVNFLGVHPRSWSLHFQTFGDLMLVAEEFNFIAASPKSKWQDPDCTAGLRVYDIADAANPRPIGFMPVEGLGLHRVWWVGERYAYASALLHGYTDHIFLCIDMADPSRPREVGRWWLPGMWTAGGESNDFAGRVALHHPVVANGVAYCGWRDAGVILLDVRDPSAPRFLGRRNLHPPFGGATHTALPLPERNLMVVADEAMSDIAIEAQKYLWMFDVRLASNPVTIATLPLPVDQDYPAKGGTFGPHNLWENRPDAFVSDTLIFATFQSAGVRLYDITNPFRPEERGFFVPPPPNRLIDPRPGIKRITHSADVYVTSDGLLYVSDYNGGFYVLEYE